MNVPNLKYIVIISLVLVGGFSSSYALITITLDGDGVGTGDMIVQGVLSGTTVENLQYQIENIPEFTADSVSVRELPSTVADIKSTADDATSAFALLIVTVAVAPVE